MAHVSEETLRRLAAGAAGEVEIERLAQHALVCQSCYALAAGHLADMATHLKREGPLKALVELIRLESEKVEETLLARADWSSFRGLTRKAQKDRVIQSRACHSRAFLEVLLAELRSTTSSREESEFLASLASLAVQGMDARKYTAELKNDLLGGVWTEVANARRRSAERHHAVAALRRAEQYLAEGTGNQLPKARALSIAASLKAEEGHISEAVALLEQCRLVYETCRDWPLVARTLVHTAYFLADSEPKRGLECLDRADPLIPAEDATLRWLAATLRTECLIEAGQVAQALLVFQQSESLLDAQTRPNARLRSKFTAARLLEALGHAKEAECLFEEVIASGLEHEWYHLAFLDFLYLLGFHVRAGAVEKAVEVSRRALAQLDLLELGHDQLRVVWTQLMDAAERQALTSQSLAVAQNYLWVYWKHPAPKMPGFTSGSSK
jgi:tetratricopeptide (TPR) repeat protein